MKYFSSIVVILYCITNHGYAQHALKNIQSEKGKEFFYTSQYREKANDNSFYYWYKAQNVYCAKGFHNQMVLEGEYLLYDLNNHIIEQGNFKNGLKTGVWKKWYANGNYAMVNNWKNGNKTGEEILFFENGNKATVAHYAKNLLHGIFIEYAKNRTLVSKGYYKNGVKNGKWTDFYNQKINYYKNGVIDKTIGLKQNKSLNKQDSSSSTHPKQINTSPNHKKIFFKNIFTKKIKTSNAQS